MTQFANYCEVEILDPYFPSEAEVRDPNLYANNVRSEMAQILGVTTTEHSYSDIFFSFAAVKANVGLDFEVEQMKSVLQMDENQLKNLLKRFQHFDTDHSG